MKVATYKNRNHFIEYLETLEKYCPDIMEAIQAEIFDRDGYPEHERWEARAYAVAMVNDWIEQLKRVKSGLEKGNL